MVASKIYTMPTTGAHRLYRAFNTGRCGLWGRRYSVQDRKWGGGGEEEGPAVCNPREPRAKTGLVRRVDATCAVGATGRFAGLRPKGGEPSNQVARSHGVVSRVASAQGALVPGREQARPHHQGLSQHSYTVKEKVTSLEEGGRAHHSGHRVRPARRGRTAEGCGGASGYPAEGDETGRGEAMETYKGIVDCDERTRRAEGVDVPPPLKPPAPTWLGAVEDETEVTLWQS